MSKNDLAITLSLVRRKFGYAFTRVVLLLCGGRSIRAGHGVLFKGRPILEVANGATVVLEDAVMLNSMQRRYHAAMPSPVRLFAERNSTIRIGYGTRIHGSCIHARESVTIGRNCLIAANCQIMDSSGHDLSYEDVDNRINTSGNVAPIIIEDAVWLGLNCIVLPGVTIGRGSVIGAGSVVTRSIPQMCFAAGMPAKVIRRCQEDLSLESTGSLSHT